MKRFAWLLLVVWGTALAQVPAVEPLVPAEQGCDCCDCGGTCGMPECVALPAVPAQPAFTERAQTVTRPEARRDVQATAELVAKFFAIFVAPATAPEALPAPADEAPVASVPLFKEHCAFLI